MPNPLLSVCLITYNHLKYIRQAIDSVLEQQVNFTWELIIADDFSTDGTREILIEYKNRFPNFITLILQDQNVGAAKNWYDLITKPKSKYIAYFEGDDYWIDPYKLQKQIEYLEQNREIVCHCHNAQVIQNNQIIRYYNNKQLNCVLNSDDLVETLGIPTASVLFRNCLRPFPEYLRKLPYDIVLYFALSRHGDFYQSEEVMSVYRLHQGGIWTGKSSLSKMNESLKIKYFYLNEMPLSKKQKLIVQKTIINTRLNRLKYYANLEFLGLNYLKDLIYLFFCRLQRNDFSYKFLIFCMIPQRIIDKIKRK